MPAEQLMRPGQRPARVERAISLRRAAAIVLARLRTGIAYGRVDHDWSLLVPLVALAVATIAAVAAALVWL